MSAASAAARALPDSALTDGSALAEGVKWVVAHGQTVTDIALLAGVDRDVVYRLSRTCSGATVRKRTERLLAPVLVGYMEAYR